MSQPPKSTIFAPRARWLSLRTVLRVMAASGMESLIISHETNTRRPATRHGLRSGRLHLQSHAVHRHHPHGGAGRQVGPFHGPERIADPDPSTPAGDGLVQRHDQADRLLGAAVEQRPVTL